MRRQTSIIPAALLIMAFMLTIPFASAYQWGRPIERTESGNKIDPGKVPTVQGKIEISQTNPLARLNPTRSSRQLSYYFPPRSAYRKGILDYHSQSKIAREQTKPVVKESPSKIEGRKRSAFVKTTPDLYPYETGSSLRPGSGQPTEVALKKKQSVSSSPGGEEE